MADRGEGPPPLFLDQTEARRAEKVFFETAPPPLSQGLDDRPHLLSKVLDPDWYCLVSSIPAQTQKLEPPCRA